MATATNGLTIGVPNAVLGCTSSEIQGTGLNFGLPSAVAGGSPATRSPAGTIDSFTATGCSVAGVTIDMRMEGVWAVDTVQFDPQLPGFIDAAVTGVTVHFSSPENPEMCSGTATGSLPIAYSRRSALVTVNAEVPNPTGAAVTVSETNGCLGLVAVGDEVGVTADYDVVWNPAS